MPSVLNHANAAVAVFAGLAAGAACTGASSDFLDPPVSYRPHFRYWLPDASVPHEVVAKDIHDMASAGAGGLEFLAFELYGLPHFYGEKPETPTDWSKYGFGTPAFTSIFKSALKAADEAGIGLDFAMGANQAQGVPAEPGTPGLSFELRQGNVTLAGGDTWNGPVPEATKPNVDIVDGAVWRHPHERFGSSKLVAVMAYQILGDDFRDRPSGQQYRHLELDFSTYIDLTSYIDEEGTLTWTAPSGAEWQILTYWERYTNQQSTIGGPNPDGFIGNGSWTVDHFNKLGAELMTDFWDTYILSNEEISDLVKKLVNHAWEDSLEPLATLYWTHGFLDRFEEESGYSLAPYLPVLFRVDNTWTQGYPQYPEEYNFANYSALANRDHAVNLDYRRVLNTGYQDFINHFLDWTSSIGVKYRHQPAYNIPMEMFSDIPMVDTPEGESFGFGRSYESYRQFTGPAQLSGKKIISSELGASPTPAYSQLISDLLYDIKMSIAGGFSQHYLHGFAYSGDYPKTTWPGYTTFFYRFTDMWNSIQPCWQHMKDVLDYVGRNQYIAQQGEAKVDLAFYSFQAPWKSGAPLINQNLSDIGYTYGYFGGDNLFLPEASVDNGVFFPSTIAAKALVFDDAQVITVAAVKKLTEFASAGLPMIFIGNLPTQSFPVTEENLAELTSAVDELRDQQSVHQISSKDELASILASLGVAPRVRLECSSPSSPYKVWRSDEETAQDTLYFFNHDRENVASCTAHIAVGADTVPYVIDAFTGSEAPLVVCSRGEGLISVPLNLGPDQTYLIALRRDDASAKDLRRTCRVTSTSDNVVSVTSNHDGTFAVLVTGDAELESAKTGKAVNVSPLSKLPEATTFETWDIEIEDWHAPAEDRFSVRTEITLHSFPDAKLVPWLELGEGMDAVSGVGHYRTKFTAPTLDNTGTRESLGGLLSLGPVAHTLRVKLNNETLPAIDISSGVIDLSDFIEQGRTYDLEVEVTTPLFNRIKADRDKTMIFGTVAGVRQEQYASRPPREEGLKGPVVINWAVKKQVGCKDEVAED